MGLLLVLLVPDRSIIRMLAGQLAGPTATLHSAAPRVAAGATAGGPGGGRAKIDIVHVLPPGWGGVHHYRIPGALMPLQPEVDVVPITGTLHVYLNAARWPDGHLRAKGFVAFLPWAAPASWANIPRLENRPMGNMVEVRFGAGIHGARPRRHLPQRRRAGAGGVLAGLRRPLLLLLLLWVTHTLRLATPAGAPCTRAGAAVAVAALGARPRLLPLL